MFEIATECLDGRAALRAIQALNPELAILDLAMPSLNGIEVLAAMDTSRVRTRVIVLTASADDHQIAEAVELGAYGFMLKDTAADTLIECMRAVSMGNRWLPVELVESAIKRVQNHLSLVEKAASVLTARENEIVRLVAEGQSNREIGRQMGITEGTVKIHLHNVYQKLGVNNRTALTAWALNFRNASRTET
ncbi:response regulator containing a CheY-like receiver domain and an HTH DNA-binding domain [Microvirga lotononidis]|uniref:Response regulator containing a CheY-like receiver domain and an HTH DNA-binding domain n=2 Tax=Microvirga lotononidis TaxID=864069 RepID=I4Z2R9_9HYPH|nr:response regulator containing a CheY-like receiver domain and an HTH DNA-binding domain [Microvirga lotononidis]